MSNPQDYLSLIDHNNNDDYLNHLYDSAEDDDLGHAAFSREISTRPVVYSSEDNYREPVRNQFPGFAQEEQAIPRDVAAHAILALQVAPQDKSSDNDELIVTEVKKSVSLDPV